MSRSAELGVNAHEKACFQNRTVVRGNFSRFPEDFWGPGLIFGVMSDQFVNGLICCYCIVSFIDPKSNNLNIDIQAAYLTDSFRKNCRTFAGDFCRCRRWPMAACLS